MPLLVKNWNTEPAGFYLEIHFTHGSDDAVTTERLFFTDTDENKDRIEMFQHAYPHLEYYCARYNDRDTEFIVDKIADKTKLSYDELYDLLEPLIRTDVTSNDTYIAAPSGYTLRLVTPEGISMMAVI